MIDSADIFVVLDHVQFERKSWQQRNKIKTSNGIVTLTLPVSREKRETRICEAEISYDRENPLKKHWMTIELAYRKAPFFHRYQLIFSELYGRKFGKLEDFNFSVIKKVCDILGISKNVIFASHLNLKDENMGKTEKIVNLCKKVGITYLYDGKAAADFLNTSLFEKEDISIEFQNYRHPIYHQLWGSFIPYLSVIDLLFNEGKSSLEIIRSGRTKN